MYVDKKLKGVDCVQTLSRLNRIFPGKETFILDFVNEPEEVLEAFRPYYNKAELADVSDQQVVYDLQGKLDEEQIYHWEEVEAFATAFYNPKASAAQLANACHPAKERFGHRFRGKEVVIMHPGPINRGVEITSQVADHANSIILDQVENGVAIRMAVLYLLAARIPRNAA